MDDSELPPIVQFLKEMGDYARRLQNGEYSHEFEAEEMRRFVATIHTKLFGWDENFAKRCGFTKNHVEDWSNKGTQEDD